MLNGPCTVLARWRIAGKEAQVLVSAALRAV